MAVVDDGGSDGTPELVCDSVKRLDGVKIRSLALSTELSALARTWWEHNKRRVTKFMTVGATGALLILGLTYFFISLLHLYYLLSTAIAIEISIVYAFFLNNSWTFHGQSKIRSLRWRFVRYNLVSLGGLSINETVLFLLTDSARLYYITSEIVAIVVAFGFNYFASLKWAWAKPGSVSPDGGSPRHASSSSSQVHPREPYCSLVHPTARELSSCYDETNLHIRL